MATQTINIKLKHAVAKVKEIWWKELPTATHKSAWIEFEKILMYRTNCSNILRGSAEIMWTLMASHKVARAEMYIE